jgi:hypothetical protein
VPVNGRIPGCARGWLAVLDRTTLADLTEGNRKLVQLLRKHA